MICLKKIIIARSLLQVFGGHNTIFERKNIATFTARTSEEILNIHGVRNADIIITDAALPLMGGARLCAALRSEDALKNVSIIMVCDSDDASLVQCRESGANIVMPRPVDPGELLWKTSELLVVPQRKDLRVPLRLAVNGLEGEASFHAASVNISLSGMLLESDRALKKGELLTCSFKIAHSAVTVRCAVEREDKDGRYGVKFINCDTKSLVIIEHFVKTMAKR